MTENRLEDGPWGQLGQPRYDPDLQTWSFKRKISYNHGIQPVNLSIQLSAPPLPRGTLTPASSQRVLKNHITKRFPEIIPSLAIINELGKEAPSDETMIKESLSTSSTLIGFGKARVKDNRNAAIDIVALASGKAGEVLRIIRPQLNKLEWLGHEGGIHLEALDPSTPLEECYWAGNGGAIRQMVFGTEIDGRSKEVQSKWLTSSSSWLAIRQINCTTIFRPVLRREAVSAIVPKGSTSRYPSSRIDANPVASIPMSKTGGLPHADVTFNPFYVTQIAIVDQRGSWSIWDMDGREGTRTVKLKPLKHGRILDKFEPDSKSSQPDTADGWGRILFAGNVNTLIVCGRCHFAAFNLQDETIRLQIPDVFNSMSSGWILDVKQNVSQLDHVFMLTSTRIFWLQIDSDDREVRILYSCRHFRDEGGGNMKLEVLSEESSCTLLLYSSSNVLVNTYRLSVNSIAECMPTSFVCQSATVEDSMKTHSMSIIAAPYASNGDTGPGSRYQDHDIIFYQLFTLSVDLELLVTLCSTTFTPAKSSTGSIKYESVIAPSVKDVKRTTRQSRLAIDAEPFIVPDDYTSDEASDEGVHGKFFGFKPPKKPGQLRAYAVDFSSIFENIFSNDVANDTEDISDFLEALPQRIKDWREEGTSSLATLADFNQGLSFSGDIDDIATSMSNLIKFLNEDAENESDKILTISQLEGTDSIPTSGKGVEGPLDFIAVYKYLIDIWVTCLPRKTPGVIRLAKERIIRQVSADLALSSVAISMVPPPVQKPGIDIDAMDLDRGTPFSLSQPNQTAESSQRRPSIASQSTDPGLPTPAYTPSLASESIQTQIEASEDPAIALLRRYTDFPIQPPLGPTMSKLLAHWTPGSNPLQYSWEVTRRINAINKDDNEEGQARRAHAKKRKRERKAERYRRGETVESAVSQVPSIATSQPDGYGYGAGGSQPVFAGVGGNMYSSQVGGPMTQLQEVVFGGRSGQKKKRVKRNPGFR